MTLSAHDPADRAASAYLALMQKMRSGSLTSLNFNPNSSLEVPYSVRWALAMTQKQDPDKQIQEAFLQFEQFLLKAIPSRILKCIKKKKTWFQISYRFNNLHPSISLTFRASVLISSSNYEIRGVWLKVNEFKGKQFLNCRALHESALNAIFEQEILGVDFRSK